MPKFTLRIPEPSPSLNKYAYSHWRVRHADKKRWSSMLAIAAGLAGATLATGKRRLTIERHGKRRLDPDNAIGGAKSCVIDNLRAMKLLIDDHDDAVELVARNVPLAKGEDAHTILFLEDIDK